MRILLADDDRVSRLLMQRTLEKFGYEVLLAEDGRAAAEILSRGDGPRLALVDWMMPQLDGPGLCRELRASRRDSSYVYLLLLTSKHDSGDVVAGLEAGADDYLTKPCHPAELRARLRTGRRILLLEETLVRAREEMRFSATHDALTMLWNRAAILALVRSELQRSARDGSPTSILLCDIDHFKTVNDHHGHLIGDTVLQEVARRLISSVRGYDGVGRYGGEEFLIVLSNCNERGIRTRAEIVRSAIATTPVQTKSGDLPISISIGAITCVGWGAEEIPIERLLAQADGALYRAKADGRNCTAFDSPLVPA
ncbi:MAG: diguanylate cyclase [Acidobacteriaceae bacterium]